MNKKPFDENDIDDLINRIIKPIVPCLGLRMSIISSNNLGVYTYDGFISFKELFDSYLIKNETLKTWEICGKL